MNNEVIKAIMQLVGQMYSQIIPFMILFFSALVLILIAVKFKEKLNEKKYQKTAYYIVTHLPYKKVKKDLGRYGEYLVYMNLREYEEKGAKFLFNVYVPKDNAETSEIDVLMISRKGLFVFESKNYSGWIFGEEKAKTWTQTLPSGGISHKEHFYNPVRQNNTHIKTLKSYLDEEIPCYSIITFSERCTLKNVTVKRNDVKVINRDEVSNTVKNMCFQKDDVLENAKIEEIYNKLYPLTQVSEEVKQKHIYDIENSLLEPSKAAIHAESEVKAKETKAENKNENKVNTENEKIIEFYDSILDEEESKNEEPQAIKEHICPKCGGKLVLRTAHKGERAGKQFYGCENYPKCRYIYNI